MAGFEVIIYGRFWVITEDTGTLPQACNDKPYFTLLNLGHPTNKN